MIVGWEDIRQATGLSQRVIKRLADMEAFPLYYISGRPVTSSSLIDEWLRKRILEERNRHLLN